MNNRAENSHLPFHGRAQHRPTGKLMLNPNTGLSSIEMTCGAGSRAANGFATRFEILVPGEWNGRGQDAAHSHRRLARTFATPVQKDSR